MSPRPCHLCQHRKPGKLASLYWAWYTTENVRVAWRQLLCSGCFTEAFLTTLRKVGENGEDEVICPVCGTDPGDDLDPLFVVLYLPKQAEREYELNTCSVDAAKLRLQVVDHGERLTDRSGSGRGPTPPADNQWSDLGL